MCILRRICLTLHAHPWHKSLTVFCKISASSGVSCSRWEYCLTFSSQPLTSNPLIIRHSYPEKSYRCASFNKKHDLIPLFVQARRANRCRMHFLSHSDYDNPRRASSSNDIMTMATSTRGLVLHSPRLNIELHFSQERHETMMHISKRRQSSIWQPSS
jgi:hypothetical protein